MAEEKDFKLSKKLTKDQIKSVLGERKECVLEEGEPCTLCGGCLLCDLDENKLCNNCGKCLDQFNTDEKGFVSIKIDKIIKDENADNVSLEELYKQYGLDGDDDQE